MRANGAQFHVLLNHFPVVLGVTSLPFLLFALWKRNAVARTALLIGATLSVLAGLSVIPTYLSGEGAEEVVEHQPWFSETLLEQHEDAAKFALAGTLLAGLAAGVVLFQLRKRAEPKIVFVAAALIFNGIAAGVTGYVAHLGGVIRHDELRAGAAEAAPTSPHAEDEE